MIWISWRQERAVVIGLVGPWIALLVSVLLLGRDQSSLLQQQSALHCGSSDGSLAVCAQLQASFIHLRREWADLVPIGAVIFAVVAGASIASVLIASEVDRRTIRVSWTQSTTRSTWLFCKLGTGIATLACLLIPLCIVLAWWSSATHFAPRVSGSGMTVSGGLVALFGVVSFGLVATAGFVIRRSGWAAASGIVLFLIVLFAANFFEAKLVHKSTAIGHYTQVASSTPGEAESETFHSGVPAGAWTVDEGWVPRGFVGIPTNAVFNQSAAELTACHAQDCVAQLRLVPESIFVSDASFPLLQAEEGAMLVSVTILLLLASHRLVNRFEA